MPTPPPADPVSPRREPPPDHAEMPRHARHDPAPPACCSCCYDCGGECGCAPVPCYYPAPVAAPCYYPAPPISSTSDHLIQAIAARLVLGSSAPAPAPQPQPQQQPPPPPPAAHQAANPYPFPHRYHYQQQEPQPHSYAHPPPPPPPPQQQQPHPGASDHGHLLLHSLLRRVAALESALPRCFPPPAPSARRTPHPNPRPRRLGRQELVEDDGDEEEESESSPPPSPPPRRRPPPRRPTRAGPPSSTRELAARTIQAHFRRFLARRSRTLRQLKVLAVLRSKCAALRGSLSGRRGGADPAAVSEAAMGLLFRLDAIQGGDPMIREGKRAVSRELTRILEFVDKVLVKEHGQPPMGNALDNDDYHEGCSAEFISNHPAMDKKKVRFSSNGQIHELNGETDKVKEVDEGSESSVSSESDEVKGITVRRSANGKPGLAAPTPVHMEARRVAGERR